MSLEGTVKLPGFGPVKKKTAAYAGAGGVFLVLAVWWYRQRKAAQSASSAASSGAAGMVTDPAGNTCSAINPATGYCPGTVEDQQAMGGAAALGGPYDTSGLGGGGLSGYYYGSGGATAVTPPGPGNFADNAEWAQYVESYMIGTLNGDPAATGNAIGKYLTGQPVTADQQNIIQEAIAYGGQPPAAGAGGYPPSIKTATGTGGGTGGGGTGGTGGSTPAGAISNLQAYGVTKTGFTARWNPVTGAHGYAWAITELNGKLVKRGTGTATSVPASGLHPGWTYNVAVQALPGGPGDNIHVALPSK